MLENLIIFGFFGVLCLLLYLLFSEVGKQRKAKSKSRLDERLSKRLLLMMSGDRQAALRLLRHARKSNPSKSLNWCQEKVISDLERDRRA